MQPLIITIDDEPAIRRSFKDFLEDSDFRVEEAENGVKGIELCTQLKPDLVLLDLSMPEMDGFEVLSKLSQISPNIPIIVVSGIGIIRDAIKALHLGAWDYLLKPIEDLTMLQHSVKKCLERARLIEENQAYQENLEKEVSKRTRELNETNIKLRSSENKFRTLAETSPMAIMMFQDKAPVYLNRAGELITGYTQQELLQLGFSVLFSADAKEAALQKIKQFEKTKPDYVRDEFEILSKNNTKKWIDISGGYTELEGKMSGIVSFIDITERKNYEQKLTDINKELEKRVSERTSELEVINRELQEAKARAEEATETKSSFLANMSHEIRTPMNGVIAAVDLALEEQTSPQVKRFLKIIQSSGYSLLDIINDILDFSKIEAGKIELERKPFRLHQLLENVSNLFISSAFEKNIDLLMDIKPGTPLHFIGDQLRIVQILSNLLSNAIKFTNELGTITIGVAGEENSADSKSANLLFYVKDSGIGMSLEQQQKIFQPFTQADISTTRKFGGTGLGLSISKRLTELMGGKIWVESQKGSGTVIYFSLLLEKQKDHVEKTVTAEQALTDTAVLVVDDNPESCRLLTPLLQSFGCIVSIADSLAGMNIQIQKAAASGQRFDFLIVDSHMPQTNETGEHTEIWKNLSESTPLILMTSIGHQLHLKQKDLVACYLYKPFTASSVLNCLLQALGQIEKTTPEKADRPPLSSIHYKTLLNGLHLLVAEDNPINQDIAVAVLEKVGITVQIAENGQEAVQAVKDSSFDAVLMDVQMPEMDGFTATQVIRKMSAGASIPILAMTAHAMKGDEERCLNAGMNGYITKPINQKKLFALLSHHIKKKSNSLPVNPPGSASASEVKLPESLAGIDIQASLQNLGVNDQTYLRFLKKFHTYHKPILESLPISFRAEDWNVLRKQAHSIQGSATNIGAYETGKQAQLLESELTVAEGVLPDKSKIAQQVNDLCTSLAIVITSIESIADMENAALPAPVTDPAVSMQTIEALMQDLYLAVETMNPKRISNAVESLKKQVGAKRIEKIEEKIQTYDYDEALDLIQKMSV